MTGFIVWAFGGTDVFIFTNINDGLDDRGQEPNLMFLGDECKCFIEELGIETTEDDPEMFSYKNLFEILNRIGRVTRKANERSAKVHLYKVVKRGDVHESEEL